MKLNEIIYNKLLLQAEEAQHQGLTKLASGILQAVGPYPAEEPENYAYSDLNKNIYDQLWKVTSQIIAYHDIKSVQAEQLDQVLNVFAEKLINELEFCLGVEGQVGPLEPKLPGQDI